MRAAVLLCSLLPGFVWGSTTTVTLLDGAGNVIADGVIALVPVDQPVAGLDHPLKASLDQVNKRFRPHVLAVQVGTLVSFPNSDNIRHQVYSFSPAKRFETKLYAGKTAAPVLFDKPGVVILGCNIHDSMRGYLYVLDTPYFATTDAAGRGVLNAPAGNYTLSIWHPRHGQGHIPQTSVHAVSQENQSIREILTLDAPDEAAPSDERVSNSR